jgi:hypothetical protein
MTGPAFDPLAGYTPDWRKKLGLADFSDVQGGSSSTPAIDPTDPLAGYSPDWRSKVAAAKASFAPLEAAQPADPALLAGIQETARAGVEETNLQGATRQLARLPGQIAGVGRQMAAALPEMGAMAAGGATALARGLAAQPHEGLGGEIPTALPDPQAGVKEAYRGSQTVKPALERINELAGEPQNIAETVARMTGPPIVLGARAVAGGLAKGAARRAAAGLADDVLMRRVHSAPSFADEFMKVRAQREAQGIPSSAASAAESGLPITTSRMEVSPRTQAEPFQSSVNATPSGPLTSREALETSVRTGASANDLDVARVGSIGPSGYKILHPTDDIQTIHRMAQQELQPYTEFLADLAGRIPGVHVMGARVKELGARLQEKAGKLGSPALVNDYLGGRVAVDDVAAANHLVAELEGTGRVVMADNFLNDPSGMRNGYRAIHVTIQRPSGISAELQIVPREIAEIQEETHRFYDVFRSTEAPIEAIEEARATSRALFDQAWERFTSRTGFQATGTPEPHYFAVRDGQEEVVLLTADPEMARAEAARVWGGYVEERIGRPQGAQMEGYGQWAQAPEPAVTPTTQFPPRAPTAEQQAVRTLANRAPAGGSPLDPDLEERLARGMPEKKVRQIQASRDFNRQRTDGPPQGFAAAFRQLEEQRAPPAPAPAADYPRGTPTRIEANTGATEAEYAILPRERVAASNIPTDLGPFKVNPRHPGNERTYAPNSDQHLGVLKQASEWNPRLVLNTDPTAVGGPPIVVPWTRELAEATGKRWEDVQGTYWTAGGNSRVMAQELLRERGRGAVIDAANRNSAEQFGLAADQVGEGNMIVRVAQEPVTTPEQARALVSRLNEVPTKALAVEEAAVSAGQKMSAETRDWFGSVYDGDKPLRSNLQSQAIARELRDRLTRDGVLDASNRARYYRADGTLTEEGKTFVERMMLGRAVPDAKLLQTATPAMVAKIEGIATLVDRSSMGGAGYDLRGPLAEILRRQGGQNVSLKRHLAQQDMLQTPPEESVIHLWRMIDDLPAKTLRERIARYVDIVEKRVVRQDVPEQAGFGLEDPTPIPSPDEAWEGAAGPAGREFTTIGGESQRGASGARILASLAGGGAAGAAIGGTQGDTPEERTRNAMIGLGAGLVGGGVAGQARRVGKFERALMDRRAGMAGRRPIMGDYMARLEQEYADKLRLARSQEKMSLGEVARRPEAVQAEELRGVTEYAPGQEDLFGTPATPARRGVRQEGLFGEGGAVGSRDPAQVDAFAGPPRTALRVGDKVITGQSRRHFDLWHERGRTGRITPKQYQDAVSRGTIEEGFLDPSGRFVPKGASNRRGAAGSKPPAPRKMELEQKYGSDEALGVTYDEEQGMSVLPSGEGATTCTNCAWEIVKREGRGRIVGYADGSNPAAKATGDFPGSGHDFAILDDRYIVDPWVVETSGMSKRAVFDLTDPGDQAEIARLYGDPKTWTQVQGPVPPPKKPIPKPLGYRASERGAVGSIADRRPQLQLVPEEPGPRPAGMADKAVSLWKTGLLTNPKTHIANILGNTAMAGLETAKDLPATLVDRIIGLGTGRKTKAFSAATTAKATWRGAREGAKDALEIIKRGENAEVGRWEVPETTFKNPIFHAYTQVVRRALGAPDAFFRKMAFERAIAEAEKLGPVTPDVLLQAIADAEYAVFQGGGRTAGVQSRIARAGEAFRKELGPAGHVIAPFTRTPGNIVGATIDYSPFGAIRGARDVLRLIKATKAGASGSELKALQKAASEQLGRSITGTSAAVLGGYILAREGKMTGHRPSSRPEQQQWDLAGKQENAVRLGGKWYSMNRFSPVGNLMALGANFYHLQQDPEASGADAVIAAAGSVGTTAMDQSFLRGVQEVSKTLEDPKGQIGKYGKNQVASLVPAVVGAAARASDRTIRDTRGGFLDAAKARIPGLSKTLPAQVDALGQEKRRSGSPLGEFFDPTAAREYKLDNPVIAELERVGANLGELNPGRARPAEVRKLEALLRNTKAPHTRELLERRLERAKSGEERGDFLERAKGEGGALNTRLRQIIGDPNYRRLPAEARREVLEAEITKFRRKLGTLRRRSGR